MEYSNYASNIDNKENLNPNYHKKQITVTVEEYKLLEEEVNKLKNELKENNNINTQVKTELLQVSKEETEEYANNMEIYANQFQSITQANKSLKKDINSYKEQLQTLAVGIEQQNEQNQRKTEQIQKLQHKNMSLQHEKVLLQQQLQSVRENFFNDDNLMKLLCKKIDINNNYPYNLNGLINFVSDSNRINNEYNALKCQLKSQEETICEYKIEVCGLQKQMEMFTENNTIEKGQLIHFQSLRLENENLRKEIRILEESNNKLANDLIERSEAKMTLMTESLNKMQIQHNKTYKDFEKKMDKTRREKKVYQHKCEHFKKEAKGFATKYEELSQKYIELEQQIVLYKNSDDNLSDDYEQRMQQLESNNDILNQELQKSRHELKEVNLLNTQYKNNINELTKELQYNKNNLQQLKASKALMETMWNEFKNNQTQQNELLLNNLQNKIEKIHFTQQENFNKQIDEYKKEIYLLKQQIKSTKMNKQQNEQINLLQQENHLLINQINNFKKQIKKYDANIDVGDDIVNQDVQSNNSSLLLINNNDVLKQRSIELKQENIKLHKQILSMKRGIENKEWEKQLHEQNLKNDIQILQTKLTHNNSKLKDKMLQIKELKGLLNNVEVKLEDLRNKYESIMQLNVKYESENSNLQLYNQSLKTNINEYKNEIKVLRNNMDHKFTGNVNDKSELIDTLKYQNNEYRNKMENLQENLMVLKQEILTLKQANNTVNDRYDCNVQMIGSHKAQIESLRVSLNNTQNRETKLIKQLNDMKLQTQKYKIESQQFKSQMIDIEQLNNKLKQQLSYNNNDNNKRYEQFRELTNKLEMACKNGEQLKITNTDMHSQIEYLKKAYEELHGELEIKEKQLRNMQKEQNKLLHGVSNNNNNNNNNNNKYKLLKDKYTVISKKYEILKEHWESLNKDRSNAIEKLKNEAQKVCESENKLSTLELAIAKLNHERTKLEKENERTKQELNKKEIQLETVDEEKLKWKARTNSLTQAHAMGEVQIQEEIQRLRSDNSNLKQEVEKQVYEIEDLQNKNNQTTQQLNEWKLKYDEINEKYEFESGQHDNTLKKLNDIRAVWDGETNLNQLLQIKQQMIQELQSKLSEYKKQRDELKIENDRMCKMMEEQNSLQSSLKTRINVQRNIINEQQHQQCNNENNNNENNLVQITMEEYDHIQQQLNILTEIQNKYDIAQQEVNELQHELSKWKNIKQDLDSSQIIPNDLNSHANETFQVQMEQLVAYLHKKEQSLHDLQDEYENLKTENNALINTIQKLEETKITLNNAFKDMENKLKTNEESLINAQSKTHSIEGQRDSLAKRLRTLSAGNAKLRVELYSLSSAADLVQEQLKTSAVALSSTTDKKQKLIQEIDNLRDALISAEQQIETLQNQNVNLQNYNDQLMNQFNTLKFTQSMKDNDNESHKLLFQHKYESNISKELQQKYNLIKTENIQISSKLTLVSKQLASVKNDYDKLQNECHGLTLKIKQFENGKHGMNIEKVELNKQINKLQNKYCTLFNEHNELIQQFQAVNHEIADMKLEKNTVFIEKDLLDYKVEQLKGDKCNIVTQLNNLRTSYFEQSKKFKTEHNELYNKYKEISGEREELKLQMERLLNEKQTLKKMLSSHDIFVNDKKNGIEMKYDELLVKNGELESKLMIIERENEQFKLKYKEINDRFINAQIKIDELNMICNSKQNDNKYTKDMIANMKDKLLEKNDEYQQLQINYHEQENKVIKFNHDLQTLLNSYNNLSAENEQLHSENQTLYEQLQMEQIKKHINITKDKIFENNNNINDDNSMNLNGINLQSLVKRGKLLTEQCADLHMENNKLQKNNNELTNKISALKQQISLLNNENKQEKSMVLMNDNNTIDFDINHHESVLRELRHRNEQLLNQVRSLQQDLETDTELINRLQKENDELRTKIKTLLQHTNDVPEKIIAVDAKGEPWQDIIKGLRTQLQEARREIAQLCEESMGKTQHINDVESSNAQLIQNIHRLEKQHKELTESLTITPIENINKSNRNYNGILTNEYDTNELLCGDMLNIIKCIKHENRIKEKLNNKLNELQDNINKIKIELIEIEENKNNLLKKNEIISHELSLLKRAKGQLSNHNEELAKEITNLQSIQFEQEQKISSQQQEICELQTLYQNIQSQLEIKESLISQFHNEKQNIIQLFAVTDKDGFMEEAKLQSIEPLMFEINNNNNNTKGNNNNKFDTLDVKHEIECLLNNYKKLINKNIELQRNIDRNEKEYVIQNDFNEKFEEIKQLLMDGQIQKQQKIFVDNNNNNNNNNNTSNNNNGSRQMSLSENTSPFRDNNNNINISKIDLNMTAPDLLNSSMQHISKIMNVHKLMKEEEFEELLNTKKELLLELDNINKKYNQLEREYKISKQQLLLLENEYKHNKNQLENINIERDTLRKEINNNKQLNDKLSKDFKSICIERDHLYEKIKLFENNNNTNEIIDENILKKEINELNDLNMKQSKQIELLQNNNNKYINRNNLITKDFQTIKTKYISLNEEYNNLSELHSQKEIQISEFTDICNKNKLKYEELLSKNTELELELDSFKFEIITKESNISSNKHITDLNEQLELLKIKYENRLLQCKKQYNLKINKMNEAITKLSSIRTKLQNELLDFEEEKEKTNIQIDYLKDELNKIISEKQILKSKLEIEFKKNKQFDRKIESALKQKLSVDKELKELQLLHNNLNNNNNNKFENLLTKYQQSIQENQIIKVAKEQYELLIKQIDNLHIQLNRSRNEHNQLREKAQLHYLRRKEEWKKLKQLENNNIKYERINKLLCNNNNSICNNINDIIKKIKNLFNISENNTENDYEIIKQYSCLNIIQFLQNINNSLHVIYTQSQIIIKKNNNNKQIKLIEQENNSLKKQIIELNNDIKELNDENNNLRKEKMNDNNNNEYLSEKINLQKQIRIIREERDNAEKALKKNNNENKQLKLKIHQLQLQFESIQQSYNNLENEKIHLKNQININNELVSKLQAEKTSLSKKNNQLYDNNINLEDKNRQSLQEIGKYQVKSDRLRQQRDYAKSKYKELKAKFNSLELQFKNLIPTNQQQQNNNTNSSQPTSQTLPF